MPSIHSEELQASNTVAKRSGIKDWDNHDGNEQHESNDYNWCGYRSRVAQLEKKPKIWSYIKIFKETFIQTTIHNNLLK